MTEYQFGQTITAAPATKVRGTFADFVDALILNPAKCPLGRDAYHALDKADPEQKKRRDRAKSVAYFIPAVLPSGAARKAQLATGLSLVACDLDDDCPPELTDRDTLAERLSGLNWVAYHSLSSTPENPRVRVVIDLAPGYPPSEYARISDHAHRLLGVRRNSESGVAVQPMFVPTLFADADPLDTPVIGWEVGGEPMRPALDEPVDALAGFDAMPPEPEKAKPEKAKPEKGAKSDAAKGIKEEAVPALPFAQRATRARHYLGSVPADLPYAEWVSVGMALHHEFKGASDGYRIFLEWSRLGKKFTGEADCRSKWTSFDGLSLERPVTIGTLVSLARREGAAPWVESDWCAEWRVNPMTGEFAHVVAGKGFREKVSPLVFDREHNCRRGDDKRPASEVFYHKIKEQGVFHGWGYDPTKPFGAQVDEVLVNKYQAPGYAGPEATEEELVEFGEALDGQLRWMLRESDHEHVPTLIDWMASVVQARRLRWALYIIGGQGVGKSMLGDLVMTAVGERNASKTSPQSVGGRFNAFVDGKQFVILEEARADGEARGLLANRLKPLITNDKIEVEAKGKDAVTRTNYAAFMVLTNHHGVMAFDRTERRYLALECEERTAADKKANPLFSTLIDRFMRSRPTVVREWFMRHRISDTFEPRFAPAMTSTLREAIEDEEHLSHAIHEVLTTSQSSRIHPKAFWMSELLNALPKHMAGERIRPQLVFPRLRDMGFHRLAGRPRVGGERPTLWAAKGVTVEAAVAILEAKAAEDTLLPA